MTDTNETKGPLDPEQALPDDVNVSLSVTFGPDKGMVKKLWKRHTILGRGGDIVISDQAASKQHAEIIVEDGQFVLRDLGSTNGTMLNSGRVWEAVLSHHDVIGIGETMIQVSLIDEAEVVTTDVVSEEDDGGEVVVMRDSDTEDTRPRRNKPFRDPLTDPLPGGIKAALQVASGPDVGKRFAITKRGTIIGRGGADLILQDMDVSRKHCSIEFMSPQKVIIKDLRSRNGTSLNNQRVSVASIKHGDSIELGETVMNFFMSAGKSQPKPGQ